MFCITPENTERYKQALAVLKERYKEQIDVYCGLEFDMYSEDTMQGYDYIIGTLHYLKLGDKFVGIDRSADAARDLINEHFDGNGLEYVKAYYEQLAQLAQYGKFDIVGHFAFTLSFNSDYVICVIIGKLIAGITSVFIGAFMYKRINDKKDVA